MQWCLAWEFLVVTWQEGQHLSPTIFCASRGLWIRNTVLICILADCLKSANGQKRRPLGFWPEDADATRHKNTAFHISPMEHVQAEAPLRRLRLHPRTFDSGEGTWRNLLEPLSILLRLSSLTQYSLLTLLSLLTLTHFTQFNRFI